jgi:hypothetical protein
MAKLPNPFDRAAAPAAKPVVDLKTLARNISPRPTVDPHDEHMAAVLTYAPPDQRPDPTVDQVLKFADLPMKELDDIIAAAELEIGALKADAQIIRDAYIKHTTRVAEDVRRLRDEVKLSMDLMRTLRKQCGLIDANAAASNITDWQVEEVTDPFQGQKS